ncbi:hypothetical protein [Cyanobium sp. Copco_Reservoir_LC18]|uniref:hypothetical protein n=1 Tax=Cyanobium sp. Copco_Reservoir_LC18 TaxID=1328305 RepID=UPI001359CBA4|nr:hypothetical protein [Cyanobium sp. Copco_Reservoir_LC18]
MFEAICSRAPGQIRITADEAYSKVYRLEDWGSVQVRDGWICPECRQPVFLKRLHERMSKNHSFVVQAHFCHHTAAAALQCDLFKSGGSRNYSRQAADHRARMQSLTRFLGNVRREPNHLEELLFAEEEIILEVASTLGASGRDGVYPMQAHIMYRMEASLPSSAQLLKAYSSIDSFQAGILALGRLWETRPIYARMPV